MRSRIVWSLLCALAIIASAFVFKGKPEAQWMESGLIGVALVFLVLKPARPVCRR